MSKKLFILTALVLLSTLIAPLVPDKVLASSGRVLISEIKLGGGNDPKEFIEIFNDTDQTVDLGNYVVEYAKAGFASNMCAETSWKSVAQPSSLVSAKDLSGTLAPRQFHIVVLGLNDTASGSARLISSTTNSFSVHDVAGWGMDRPCFQSVKSAIPPNEQSVKRTFDPFGNIQLVQSAAGDDFILSTIPTPGTDECNAPNCFVEAAEPEGETLPYYSVQITELLPDPATPLSDSQDEFIELHNPYDFPVDLSDYILHTGTSSSTYSYSLAGIIMEPYEYRALYSKDTNLTLVNSSEGQAWLVSPNHVRVSETDSYPANPGTGKAWALINEVWQTTDMLTPGAENLFPPTETNNTDEPETILEACPEGKYRNPETNRCKTIETASDTLMACQPGQQRNPDTNRCRSVVADATGVTPCAEGQERNPETNRCRKIASIEDGPAPCQAGYERNSETNRCRKVQEVKGTITETPSGPHNRAKLNYLIIGVVSAMVIGYGLYEYRQDVRTSFQRLKKRFRKGSK